MCAERIADFKRIPTMIRCSHLDAIVIFYHIGSLRQFESIHQKVVIFDVISSTNSKHFKITSVDELLVNFNKGKKYRIVLFPEVMSELSTDIKFSFLLIQWVPTVRRLYHSTPFIICATGIEARLPRDVRQLLFRKQLGEVEVGKFFPRPSDGL